MRLEHTETGWQAEAEGPACASCPECAVTSRSRHSRYWRTLRDLPAQGSIVTLRIRSSRWRCRNDLCQKKFFSTPLATIAAAYERQTSRANAVTLMVGRALGGRAAERLMSRLGMPVSDDTVLRRLKHAACQHEEAKLRVIGIDDWAQRKGQIYGTIVVDLERRCVVDLLPDRSAETVVRWLRAHPEVHTISRDRNGLYAQAVRQAAPHAMQIADRFHLVQNLREAAQRELATQRTYLGVRLIPPLAPLAPIAAVPVDPPARPQKNRIVLSAPVIQLDEIAQQRRQHDLETFAAVIRLRGQGLNVKQISHTLQLNRRRFDRWLKWGAVPERNRMAPRPGLCESFREYLWQRWQEGNRNGRALLAEILKLGYVGCYSHLARLLAEWRRPAPAEGNEITSICPAASTKIMAASKAPELPPTETVLLRRQISPQVAAALLSKPGALLSIQQGEIVKQLKANCPGFAVMRTLVLSFRGILQKGKVSTLHRWLHRAKASGLHSMKQFARTLRQDLSAVEAAILQDWSNGPVEGQVNRLKTLKRQMYGRAGIDLLRARLRSFTEQQI